MALKDQALLEAVKARQQANADGQFRCPLPNHGKGNADRNPSAQIFLDNGRVGVKCYAGCDGKELWAAVVKPHLPDRRVDWRVTRTYQHPDGYQVQALRFDWTGGYGCPVRVRRGKTRELVDCDNTALHKHPLPGVDGRPMRTGERNLEGLLLAIEWPDGADSGPDTPIILVEGEKTADAVLAAGMPVACWYGGTGKVEQADWTPAKGWRFILWPDDDLAGRNAMHKAASLIQRAGGEVVGIVNTSGKSGNDAADLAVGQRAAVIAGAVDYIPPEQPAIKQAEDDGAGGEFAAGVWYAQRYLTPGVDQPGWLFSWSSNAWFYWDKSVWTDPPAPEKQIRVDIAARRDELAAEAKLAGVSGKAFTSSQARWHQSIPPDFKAGLLKTLAGELSLPPAYLLNTPDGQLDLRQPNPALTPSDPDAWHRAVTGGRYIPNSPALADTLEQRVGAALDDDATEAFYRMAALTLSGRAQSLRSIALITGASGSGKGGCLRLLAAALGTYAATADAGWLDNRKGSDTDAKLAELLWTGPRAILIDELGADAKLAKSRLLTLTGDNTLTARRPYQPVPYTGRLNAAVWTTAVVPPRLDTGDGIERRLAVIPTRDQALSAAVRQQDGISQELKDAFLTVAIGDAYRCYQSEYQPPEGVSAARKAALDDMDQLQSWLDGLDEAWAGQPISALLKDAAGEFGDWVTARYLGKKVKESARWQSRRERRNGKRETLIYLRQRGFPGD